MKKDLTIVRVDVNAIAPEILDKWARLYCEIWKEPPWNEDFWQPKSVAENLIKELRYLNGSGYLVLDQDLVVGFTHGYSVTRDELRVIAGNSLLDILFEKHDRIFYVDELGVASSHRGQRISLKLTSALIEHARSSGIWGITLRTDVEATAARHVYRELGFIELSIHDAAHPTRTYWFLE